MRTISSITRSGLSGGWGRWVASWPIGVLAYWKRKEMIKTLRTLSDHQLRDIGLRRDQIETAVNGATDLDIVRFR